MSVRMTAVAGQFYESSPKGCLKQVQQLLPNEPLTGLPARIVAGVVPHAGWVFSGDLSALVFAAIRGQQAVDTFVIFGAVHRVCASSHGLLYDSGQWGSPLGVIDVDEELAAAILDEAPDIIKADTSVHFREHSIEVQVPFIQHLFPDAKIVPLMVPPILEACEIGRSVGRVISRSDKRIVAVASTDLTHYGPSYNFTPMGIGPEAIRWAKEQNDKFFINLAVTMQADKLVESSGMYNSACGAGAVAGAVGTAVELGVVEGKLLGHTTSAEIVEKKYNQQSMDSVGYAAIVFGL